MAEISIRTLIWQNLLDELDTINTGNGYYTDPTVSEFTPPAPDELDGGPWIVLGMGEDSVAEYSAGPAYRHEWTITLDCYVAKASYQPTVPLFKLTQDVRRIVAPFSTAIESEAKAWARVGGSEYFEGVLGETDGHVVSRELIVVSYKTKDAW